MLIGDKDFEKSRRYFTADAKIKNCDTLTLGNTTIKFLETPAHTEGTISFFFNTEENGLTYRVGMFGEAGANTLAEDKTKFDGAREAYRASLERLKKEKVDVFIGYHTWNNDIFNKAKILLETGENTFIAPELWCKFLDFCENRLNNL